VLLSELAYIYVMSSLFLCLPLQLLIVNLIPLFLLEHLTQRHQYHVDRVETRLQCECSLSLQGALTVVRLELALTKHSLRSLDSVLFTFLKFSIALVVLLISDAGAADLALEPVAKVGQGSVIFSQTKGVGPN